MPMRKKGNEAASRGPVKIALSGIAHTTVNKWLDRNRGWGKSAFLELLVERFALMPEALQHLMTGVAPAELREQYAAIGEKFFRELAHDPTKWAALGSAALSSHAPRPAPPAAPSDGVPVESAGERSDHIVVLEKDGTETRVPVKGRPGRQLKTGKRGPRTADPKKKRNRKGAEDGPMPNRHDLQAESLA